jgi:hypothetical protein
MRRRRRDKRRAPATIQYTTAKNAAGHSQLCVFAMCEMGMTKVGPIWGHGESSVKRALATLTSECQCPATFHCAEEWRGKRILTQACSKR